MSLEKLQELFERYEQTYTDYGGIEITDVNQEGLGEDRLLHFAASYESYEDVSLLLDHGAQVNAKGDIGLTPLHCAASKGKLEIVELLLKNGADRTIQNEFGETAADWAFNNGHDYIGKLLSK